MIRLGLVGTGAWGRKIAATVDTLVGVRLDSVVVRPGKPPPPFPFAFKEFSSFEEMLDHKLDGVIIATPASTHARMLSDVIARKIPVFVEKPVTTNLIDAEKIAARWAANGQPTLLVNHVQLFNPAVLDIRNFISSREGAVEIRGYHHGWGPFRSDCSGLWDYGAHDIAVALFLSKFPENRAVTKVSDPKTIPGPMGGYAETTWIKLRLGTATADLLVGNGLPEKRRRYSAMCTTGDMIDFLESRHPRMLMHERDATLPVSISSSTPPLTASLQAFVESIDGKKDPGEDARFGMGIPLEVIRLLTDCDKYLVHNGILRPQMQPPTI